MKIVKILPLLIVTLAVSCTQNNSATSSSSKESSSLSSSQEASKTTSDKSSNAITPSLFSSSLSSLTSSSAYSSNFVPTPNREADFIFKDASYYEPIKGSSGYTRIKKATIKYAIKDGNEFIPYTTFDAALKLLFADYTKERNGSLLTYTCPDGLVFIVDKDNDTVTAKNYDEINLFSKAYDTKLGIIDEETTRGYVKNNDHIYEGGEDVVFDLKNYNFGIYEYDDEFYMPFSTINTMTLNYAFWSSVNFNGSDFYRLDFINGGMSLNYSGYEFDKSFHDGNYYKKNARSNYEFREYNYNALMFHLDYSYGLRDKMYVPFHSFLANNYPGTILELKSDNEITYLHAVETLMEKIIGDGHTNVGDEVSACSNNGRMSNLGVKSQRVTDLYNSYYDCYDLRSRAIPSGPLNVRFYNFTAIITFDSFRHCGAEFTSSNISNYAQIDSFAAVYSAFTHIIERNEIKNVIFDMTLNGGGDTNAAVPILCFMKDKINVTMYSPLTKLAGNLSYSADTNLDGVYDEKDNYAGKYNFYVLTSNYSFSCANLFPHVAKQNGAAKIIGERSAGGSCPVYYTATPDGKTFRISASSLRFGYKENPAKDNDDGVELDYAIDKQYFYNDQYLDNFLNNL